MNNRTWYCCFNVLLDKIKAGNCLLVPQLIFAIWLVQETQLSGNHGMRSCHSSFQLVLQVLPTHSLWSQTDNWNNKDFGMQLNNNCVNMPFPPRRASAVISNMHFPMKGAGRGSWPRRSETRATLASPFSWIPGPEDLLQWWVEETLSAFCCPYNLTKNSYAHPFQGAYTHVSVHAYICVWQG